MIYCFDLDGTLCSHLKDYRKARPFPERIAVVNKLFDEGNYIIVDSARGSKTKTDWDILTQGQLRKWKLKYNELHTGSKVYADVYVDDKALSDKQFFK